MIASGAINASIISLRRANAMVHSLSSLPGTLGWRDTQVHAKMVARQLQMISCTALQLLELGQDEDSSAARTCSADSSLPRFELSAMLPVAVDMLLNSLQNGAVKFPEAHR